MHIDHFQIMHFLKEKDLTHLHFSVILRSFATGLLGIFLPLYLFKDLAYSFDKILLFFLIFALVSAISTPFFARITSKIGLKHSIFLSIPIEIIFVILLYLLKFNVVHYSIVAILLALSTALFWIAFNSEFYEFSKKKYRCQDVSISTAVLFLAGMLGPLVGAFILTFLGGFRTLFLVYTAIMLLSVIPLYFSKEIHEPLPNFSIKNIFIKKHLRDFSAFLSYGILNQSIKILWPIFIFILFDDYLKLGFIATICGIITVLFTLYIGRLTLAINPTRLLKFGTMLNTLVWFIKIFVRTLPQIIIIGTLSLISFNTIKVPFDTKTYNKINKKSPLEYIIFKQVSGYLGMALITFLTLIIFYLNLSTPLIYILGISFGLTALSSYFLNYI